MNNPVRFTDPTGLWSKDIHASLTRTAMSRISTGRDNAVMFGNHVEFIVTGNLAVDGPNYAAFNNWYSRSAQGRHFNRAFLGGRDSRLVWADYYMDRAVSNWRLADNLFSGGLICFHERNAMREAALTLLGRGLHSIQDIEAHGNIGMGNRITAFHLWGADNPDYDWLNMLRGNTIPSTERVRYNTSINDSEAFLLDFYRQIGWID